MEKLPPIPLMWTSESNPVSCKYSSFKDVNPSRDDKMWLVKIFSLMSRTSRLGSIDDRVSKTYTCTCIQYNVKETNKCEKNIIKKL